MGLSSTTARKRPAIETASEDGLRPASSKLRVGLAYVAKNHSPSLFLALLIIIGGTTSNVFLTLSNLTNILWISSILGMVSLGQCVLIIAAQFDMSVAYSIALSGIVAIVMQNHGAGLVMSIVVGLLSGVVVGLFNGAIVVWAHANPFLVTLGSQTLIYAVCLSITKSNTLYATAPGFEAIGRDELFSTVSISGVAFIVLAIILEIVLKRTQYGRALYVVGSNARVAHLSGIPVRRVLLTAFALCATVSAAAGIFMASRNASTVADVGVGMDFQSIIAVVLGGTSLFGGRGGALRTVVGVLILGVLGNLMILIGMPVEGQDITEGIVFLIVVLIDSQLRKRRV